MSPFSSKVGLASKVVFAGSVIRMYPCIKSGDTLPLPSVSIGKAKYLGLPFVPDSMTILWVLVIGSYCFKRPLQVTKRPSVKNRVSSVALVFGCFTKQ